MSASYLNQNEYTPVGDLIVIALCMIVGIMLLINRVHKSGGFRIMFVMLLSILAAAFSSLFYRILIGSEPPYNAIPIYITRIVHHSSLSLMQVMYILYLKEPLWMKTEGYRKFIAAVHTVAFVPIVIDIAGILTKTGFYVTEDALHSGFTVYPFAYGAYMFIVFYVVIFYRSRIIKQIFWGLLGTNLVSVLMISMQGAHHQSSFTTFAYFLPVIGILFMFHSNPYDAETGAAGDTFFYHELSGAIEKKTPLLMISCTIADFYSRIKEDPDLKREFFGFFRQNIRQGVLYRFPSGRLVLTMKKRKSKNFDKAVEGMINDFYGRYGRLHIDYRLIVAETVPEISSPDDYIRLIDFIESETPVNSTHRISEGDIKRFLDSSYIVSELEDIVHRYDLSDERVLVYCQPVFNIMSGTYDTAEALMRLRLPETGLVFPDKFIPIAEKYNYIHTLSLIILNKTCAAVKKLLDEGYILNRLSVNFSTIDLKHEGFCAEVQDIIERNDIPYEKIAVEITESRSELEFNRMKQQVEELQKLGIKFYLDDFGTGYSNFERIMEIPFDIIKFDRSLLIESVKSDSSKYMVSTFANMFDQLNYSVLFEGVEDERDEQYCVNMKASYLQGYKYSKPIPIEELRNFLSSCEAV